MSSLAERLGVAGTDTLRVEKMRELLADHYRQRDAINQNYSDILRLVPDADIEKYKEELQNQMKANANLRRVTINRFSGVLHEDWEPGV